MLLGQRGAGGGVKTKVMHSVSSCFPTKTGEGQCVLSGASLASWSGCPPFPGVAWAHCCSATRDIVLRKDEEEIKEPPPHQLWHFIAEERSCLSSVLQLTGPSSPAPTLCSAGHPLHNGNGEYCAWLQL